MTAAHPSTLGASHTRTNSPEPSPRSNPVDNEAAVRRLVEEGFNQGNLGVLDELLSDSFVEHQALPPALPPTKAAVVAIIRALRAGFSDLHLEIEALDAVGDRVWWKVRATGTHDGPFMGSPPTGRRLSIDVFDLVRFKAGRMAEHWGVPDNLSTLAQLGLLPSEE
jgi:SnoaL-like polyketide cyclase